MLLFRSYETMILPLLLLLLLERSSCLVPVSHLGRRQATTPRQTANHPPFGTTSQNPRCYYYRYISSSSSLLYNNKNDDSTDYSRSVRLREEVESPFSKVRLFVSLALLGGAVISLLLSLARIAAALQGINPELMSQSLTNVGVDMAGILLLGLLLQRDLAAQASRLARATKGAALAKLTVRASGQLVSSVSPSNTFVTPLSSFRSGRGLEKRVVIGVAGLERLQQVVQEDVTRLKEALLVNDLIFIPVVIPFPSSLQSFWTDDLPPCVALPVLTNDWKQVMEDEVQQARKQGIDVENDGVSVVLKKNGRVGQRTKGIRLETMVQNVQARRESGMDIKNI